MSRTAEQQEDASKNTIYNARDNADTAKRMIKGYNKNRNKIKNQPNQPEVSQSEKRRRKLIDLGSRSSSWKGLENYNMNKISMIMFVSLGNSISHHEQ